MSTTRSESGQTLVVLAIGLLILILFVGLAVDGGMAYITKAKLSKAVDAACLAGMKALPQGQPTATTLATHIFNANFGPNPPVPTITFPLDSHGSQQVSVTATTLVPTFFAQHFFQFWHVSDTAVSTRGTLILSLVLDRSGSMNGTTGTTKGGPSLQVAAPIFVDDWDNAKDELAMVSFASHASVDFPIATSFQASINSKIAALTFTGGTFGTGGTYLANYGPPLTLADNQITSVPIQPGVNTIRVAMYFTDGLMNTIQDTFTCYNNTRTKITPNPLINYGGFDSGSVFASLDPTSETIWSPTSGDTSLYYAANKICYQSNGSTPVSTFPSQKTGTQLALTQTNITADAQYRAIQTATAMRSETPGTYIYVIGLGSQVSGSTSTKNFLGQLANDPSYSTYNSSLPDGLFLVVPDCPGTACTSELTTAFQTIYAKIALRLTQ